MPRRLAVAAAALLTAIVAGCGDHNTAGGGHTGGAQATASVPTDATFNGADVTFTAEMIPHHQQALEMATIATTRASNKKVKDLAARISKAQGPEIVTMAGWLRQWGQPVPSGTISMDHGDMPGGMMTHQEMTDLAAASGANFDRMFLDMMIRHHQGAIDMANTEQQQGKDPQVKQLAVKIAADQAAEIKEMQDLLKQL